MGLAAVRPVLAQLRLAAGVRLAALLAVPLDVHGAGGGRVVVEFGGQFPDEHLDD